MSVLNNIALGLLGLYSGDSPQAYIRGAYIWNEVSVIIAVIFRESEVYSIQLEKACIFLL
jgi:hypothetical protein